MDSLEQELWRMIDVRGYGAHVSTPPDNLTNIKNKVKEGKPVEKDWQVIKDHYSIIKKGIEVKNFNGC